MKKIKLLTLAGVLGVCLFSSVSTFAGVIFSQGFTGYSGESGAISLGSGGRYITGSGTNRTARADAMKVIPYLPDSSQATIYLSNGEWSQRYFDADSYNSSGETQSYYIKWSASYSNASGVVNFQD